MTHSDFPDLTELCEKTILGMVCSKTCPSEELKIYVLFVQYYNELGYEREKIITRLQAMGEWFRQRHNISPLKNWKDVIAKANEFSEAGENFQPEQFFANFWIVMAYTFNKRVSHNSMVSMIDLSDEKV